MAALSEAALVKARQKLARSSAGRPPIHRLSFAPGALANTNIAVAGITMEDVILAVLQLSGGNITTDEASTTNITTPGNIQDTNSTAGSTLLIFWLDVTASPTGVP